MLGELNQNNNITEMDNPFSSNVGLVQLSIEKVKLLRNNHKLANNIVGYYTLENYLRWKKIDPNIKHLRLYALIQKTATHFRMVNATFIIVDRYQLFFNSLSSCIWLKRALSLFDWSPGYKVSTYLDRHKDILFEVFANKKLTLEWENSSTPLAYFPKEKAAEVELNCPDDIDLKPLTEEDALTVNSIWPNRHFGSLFLIKRLIKLNPSIGAYKRDTNELVAWCLQLQAGALGALQVKEEHKRKGYGSLVVRAMTKVLAGNNNDSYACVGEGNIASFELFKKCGFVIIDGCNWVRTKPTKPLNIDWEQE